MNIDNSSPGKDVSSDDLKTKLPLVSKKSPTHFTSFEIGHVTLGGRDAVTMVGPNLVENREMILEVAKFASDNGVKILRGGCFKPLTFPYRSDKYFETGEEGLRWLREAGDTFGLLTITEVIRESDVSLVSSYSDIIQIGTRNMQNFPLLVAAAKSDKPILLKRGFGSSLRDWLGAAEYILNEGNSKLILCERGVVVPHTHRSTSRFLLDLQVIPALRELTHLPVITDPSHATFWAPWVTSMALASVAAGVDGVMIEVHPNPRDAAVDPLQALSFEEASVLLKKCRDVATVLGRDLD